jgi:competence protein ComEA
LPGLALPASWPRPAQWAAVALVSLATALLALHAWRHLRVGARPTELQRGAGLAYRVDLNRASFSELLQLPGVGNNLARRIEHYRQAAGGFRRVEDLREVGGIGPATLERLRPWVCVGSEGAEESEPPADDRPAPRKAVAKAGRPPSQREVALKGVRINVNRASRADLQRLPGIGPKLAQRLLDERGRRPFASVDELRRVPGIGPKTLARLRPYVAVAGDAVQVRQAK